MALDYLEKGYPLAYVEPDGGQDGNQFIEIELHERDQKYELLIKTKLLEPMNAGEELKVSVDMAEILQLLGRCESSIREKERREQKKK